MKNLIILITIILSVNLNAQDTIRHWFDTYYYEKENIEIPSLQFEIVNQEILETFEDEIFPRGYVQKVEIQFFEYAKLIRKRDVNVYLLHLFALNSERFSFDMDFAIPENAFIEVIEGADRIVEHLTSKDNYRSDDSKSHIRGRNIGGTSNECIIRVEIPKRKVSKAKIHINALFIFLLTNDSKEGFNTKATNVGVSTTTTTTTTTTTNNNNNNICSYVSCMDEYANWTREWKSTFEIWTELILTDYSRISVKSTGFLLNTSDNYGLDYNAMPYAMLCHHWLFPDPVNYPHNNTVDDILGNVNNKFKTKILLDKFATCDGIRNTPIEINPEFTVLERGNWTSIADTEEDYIFVQFGGNNNLGFFDSKNLTFAGWRNDLIDSYDYGDLSPSYVFNHSTHADFGYGLYAIDRRDPSPVWGNNNLVRISIEEGFSGFGGSGSPMFNKNHEVFAVQIEVDRDLSPNITDCDYYTPNNRRGIEGIAFSSLWKRAHLDRYLGNSEMAYSFSPSWLYAPEHCDDCKFSPLDNEENMDCGGPCKPCRAYDAFNVALNDFTIRPVIATATNNITATGSESDPFIFEDNTTLAAGNSITFNANVEIPLGVTLKAATGTQVDPIVVVREPDALCSFGTPNYLVWGRVLNFTAGNVDKFKLEVYNRYGQEVYNSATEVVIFDGKIPMWNTNINKNINTAVESVLTCLLYVWDTQGTEKLHSFYVHAFPCNDPNGCEWEPPL